MTRQARLVPAGCLMSGVACRAPSASSWSSSWYRFTGRVAASVGHGRRKSDRELQGKAVDLFKLLMHKIVFRAFSVQFHGSQAPVRT